MLKLPSFQTILKVLPPEDVKEGSSSPERVEQDIQDLDFFSTSDALPKNANEVLRNSGKFVKKRAGSKSKAYSIGDLQKIARNLGLKASGSKGDLVDRILDFAKKNSI